VTHCLLDSPYSVRLAPRLNDGLTSDMGVKMKALERESRELRQANKILRKASAYFAEAELSLAAPGTSLGDGCAMLSVDQK